MVTVSLGLVPVSDDDETIESLDRIAEGLAGQLGTGCAVHRAVSPQALAAVFEAGVVNLVWSSPTLVLVAPELRSAVPIVTSVREGVAHYHGVIFVQKDSLIRSVLDLEMETEKHREAKAKWQAEAGPLAAELKRHEVVLAPKFDAWLAAGAAMPTGGVWKVVELASTKSKAGAPLVMPSLLCSKAAALGNT